MGNSIFFVGLVLLVLAAIVLSASDVGATPIALSIGGVALLLLAIGAWLWTEGDSNERSELSLLSPMSKIVAGIGGLVFLLLPADTTDKIHQFLWVGLVAVAIVGAVELYIDRKHPSMKDDWDRMRSWKKVVVSTLVIVLAFLAFGAAAMLVANRV